MHQNVHPGDGRRCLGSTVQVDLNWGSGMRVSTLRAKFNKGSGTYYTANNSAVGDRHTIGRSAGDIDGLEPRAQHAVCHTEPRCLGIAGECIQYQIQTILVGFLGSTCCLSSPSMPAVRSHSPQRMLEVLPNRGIAWKTYASAGQWPHLFGWNGRQKI